MKTDLGSIAKGYLMNTEIFSHPSGTRLRVPCPNGNMSLTRARFLLNLSIPEEDKTRIRQLSAKARAGELTDAEAELDHYEEIDTVLSSLKSRARRRLNQMPGRVSGV